MTDPDSFGDPQLDLLAAYLGSPDLDETVMTLPELDGFLAGLAAGPQEVPVEEWLPLIWDEAPPAFTGDDQAAAVLGAIMAHREAIVGAIAAGTYAPTFWADIDGAPLPEDWAVGFMTAAGLREESWRPLLQSEDDGMLLYPILAFCDDEAGQAMIEMSKRDREILRAQAVDQISGAVLDVAEYWGRRPQSPPTTPIVRTGPKIGRNDPCPCGSGKKHKKCCGA